MADGTLWIADAANGRLQHLAADGTVLQVIGPFTEPSQDLKSPNDVEVDAAGRIWTTDYLGGGVVAFSADGKFLGRFAAPALAKPVSLTFDAAGRLYVTEWERDVVYAFDVTLT